MPLGVCLFLSLSLHLVFLSIFLHLSTHLSASLSLSPSLTRSVSVSLPSFICSLSASVSQCPEWNSKVSTIQIKRSQSHSLHRPTSTHKHTGHSDTYAKTDAHKTVTWGHMPISTFTPSLLSGYFKFSVGGKEWPPPTSGVGWELSEVLKHRSKKRGLLTHASSC